MCFLELENSPKKNKVSLKYLQMEKGDQVQEKDLYVNNKVYMEV